MPVQVSLYSLSGTSPFDVYICQSNLTGCFYIDTITNANIPYTFNIPSPYDTAESYCVKVVDSQGCVISGCSEINPTPTPTNTITPTNTRTPVVTPTNTSTPTPTPSVTSSVGPSMTPTQTPTLTPTYTPSGTIGASATPTQTQTETPTQTPTYTPTNTPSADPYPFTLAGYCNDGRMSAGGSYSSQCTAVQSGGGSATRYKSNYPYSYLFTGQWATVNMYIYDTLTSTLLLNTAISDGCQYWETNGAGVVAIGYPQPGFDCSGTLSPCCPGVAPSPS